jgi:hypothetical protein
VSLRILFLTTAVIWCAFTAQSVFAGMRESAYRILEGPPACLPCGAEPRYLVVGSHEEVSDLHAKLTERCGGSESPDAWRQSVLGLRVDFRDEAIIAMYEVIGTGGQPSLDIAGPEDGVLKAAITWHTGPPPHPPIATAACFTFAVRKSAVKRVDIMPGGVLSKDRSERSLVVATQGTE